MQLHDAPSTVRSKYGTQTWHLVGKGPSFSEYDPKRHRPSLGLNHVCTVTKVDATHLSDWDVVAACGDSLVENSRYLIIPWYPHEGFKPSVPSLDKRCRGVDVLEFLAESGRLLTYDSSLAHNLPPGGWTQIYSRAFGSVAACCILAEAGVKRIMTFGIDGGSSYHEAFDPSTLLANGRKDFESQFVHIIKIQGWYGLRVLKGGVK